jgi:Domain of unknown function (DUF4844)
MQSEQSQADYLISFKQRDKFSLSAWNERGLNPSSEELCAHLTTVLNSCADNLIQAMKAHSSAKQLKSILKTSLANLNRSDYDTEEREFIVDLFHELATIVNVDFNNNLNKWLYGLVLTTLTKLQSNLRPDRIVETLKQPCTSCGTQLETHILGKADGIPETSWFIGKCNNCGELNLISLGPNIKETRFGNYQWIDQLHKEEYTYEHALTRLEQIKTFRK